MSQFKANLGKFSELNYASVVTDQYNNGGPAIGKFAEVFDTHEDPSDSQLRIYNIVTMMGGFTLPASEGQERSVEILGKLIYGIGSATFEVDFDWKNGSQMSVAASFVRVLAAYSVFTTANNPPAVKIGAMLSSGSRAARSQSTRSYPKIAIEAEDVAVFPVPPMAHGIYLFAEEAEFYETGGATIRFVGGASGGSQAASTDLASFQSDGSIFLSALANEDGVRFPESARWVEVTNSGEDTLHLTPCFTLSL